MIATQERNRILMICAGLILVMSVVLGLQTRTGEAHAGLDRSVPSPDELVTEAPTEVELYFTQELNPDGLIVAVLGGPDGPRVDLLDAAIDLCDPSRKRVTVSLPAELPDGEYLVQWQTLSNEDGETDAGAFTFTIAAGTASPVANPSGSPVGSPEASPAGSPDASPAAC
jgi:copper transport protein